MAFFRKGKNANYSILNNYSFYVPSVKGVLVILAWLLLGFVIAQFTGAAIMLAMPSIRLEVLQLVVYPLMFVPAMIATRSVSSRNEFFTDGYALDSRHFGRGGIMAAAALCCLGTAALAFLSDSLQSLLPPMPETLQKALEQMTGGNVIICFISVSIFAPFFEEWLIRGMILRGLLNCRRRNGKTGYSPAVSILISSFIFALIHANPWQAIPAFLLGCFFGYVYYKTGSLKLTMLMHFFNNTIALVLTNVLTDKELVDWTTVLPAGTYAAIAVVAAAIVAAAVLYFRKIKDGGCDFIPAGEP